MSSKSDFVVPPPSSTQTDFVVPPQSDFVVPPPSSTQSEFVVPPPYNQNPLRPAQPVQSGGAYQHSKNWVSSGTAVESFSSPPTHPNQPIKYTSSLSHFYQAPPRKLIPLEPPQLITPMNRDSFYTPPPPPLSNIPPRPPRYYPPSQHFQFLNKPAIQPPPPPVDPPLPTPVTLTSPALPTGRSVNTGEEKKLPYKKRMEKRGHHFEQSENKVVSTRKKKGHGSSGADISGTRAAAKNDNRLRRPSVFSGKMKYWNQLPEPTDQPKLHLSKRGKNRFTKYRFSSLEKQHRPQLYTEPDLGIPLDLLDLSVYNPPKGVNLCLDQEDEELLCDDDSLTSPVKKDGLRIKERPGHRDVSWLLKTQYISSLQTMTGMNQSREKELPKLRGSQSIRNNFDMREKQIQDTEASFKASKIPSVHTTNRDLHPVEVLPLLPDSNREGDQFVVETLDSSPTGDSKMYKKLKNSVGDAHESQPLDPTNLILREKRAIGQKLSDEVEDLPAPSRSFSSARKRASASRPQRLNMVDNSDLQGTVMQESARDHSIPAKYKITRPSRTKKTPAYLADYEL